jgi:L,D-transpeptidase catalytic domain
MNRLTRSLKSPITARIAGAAACAGLAFLLSNCASSKQELKVSVKDQKMALYDSGQVVRVYGVSTSKFGTGDRRGSCCTPLGKLKVAQKIGAGMPPGMVFKSRRPTGEILRPNAPGRDPIVTRIMWLQGAQGKNRNAFARTIYIHGTPEECHIGHPASYGCIRMRSMDIIDLYNRVPVGATVRVNEGGLPLEAEEVPEYVYVPPVRSGQPGSSTETTVAKTSLGHDPDAKRIAQVKH